MAETIYWIVDGKPVPKPGNKRDPDRLYKSVNGQIIELTAEEERATRDEWARNEADRPKREAEAKARAEKEERFRQTIKYENRIVAFVDVLGWRHFTTRSVDDPEMVRNVGSMLIGHERFRRSIKEMMRQGAEVDAPIEADPFGIEVSQFSDSFILSCEPGQHMHLASQLKFLSESMLALGFLARGGIAYGLVYHRSSVAFGPAVVKAYELEKQAVYPRIILDVDLDSALFPGVRFLNKDGSLLGFGKTWRRDHDGRAFLDFLQPLLANTWQQFPPQFFQRHFVRPRQTIGELFARYKAHSLLSGKYYWLARYFNSVLAEYPDVTVEPIELN